LSARAAGHLGMGYQAQTADGYGVSYGLEANGASFLFNAESEEATTLAEISSAAATTPRLAAAIPSRLRHPQAGLIQVNAAARSVLEGPLRPGTGYAVEVNVGFGQGIRVVNPQSAIPVMPGAEDRLMTCVFSESNLLDEPQPGCSAAR